VDTYLKTGLQALGDPTRLAILESLAHRPSAVVDLAKGFSVSRPAVSQHLRVLSDAGLISHRRAGAQRIYQIDAAGITALKKHFDALWSSVLLNLKVAAEADASSAPAPRARKKS
jgi:DNA-binding transcriptional ArsR family regulator